MWHKTNSKHTVMLIQKDDGNKKGFKDLLRLLVDEGGGKEER